MARHRHLERELQAFVNLLMRALGAEVTSSRTVHILSDGAISPASSGWFLQGNETARNFGPAP